MTRAIWWLLKRTIKDMLTQYKQRIDALKYQSILDTAREAWSEDNHYLIDLAEAAGKERAMIDWLMDEFGYTQEEAIEKSSRFSHRGLMIRKKKYERDGKL